MIRAIFVLFSCVVSRIRNCPVSKYSRYRIGLPSVLRRRLRAPEDSSSVPRTTDHHTVRVRESPRDPRNLIRSRTPVRNPSASSHATIIPRRNILTNSDLKVFPPRLRCASDGSSPHVALLSKIAMHLRYINRASSSSQHTGAVTTRSAGVTHTRICMQNSVTHPKIHVFMLDLPGVELRCHQIRSSFTRTTSNEIFQFCLTRDRVVIYHLLYL